MGSGKTEAPSSDLAAVSETSVSCGSLMEQQRGVGHPRLLSCAAACALKTGQPPCQIPARS